MYCGQLVMYAPCETVGTMKNKRIFDRLEVGLQAIGKTGPWLYKQLNIGKQAYSNWRNAVNGQDVPLEQCHAIAKITPIRLEFLVYGELPMLDESRAHGMISEYAPNSIQIQSDKGFHPARFATNQPMIPLISGGLMKIMNAKNDSPELAEAPRLRVIGDATNALYLKAYRVVDDSLLPAVQRGFIIEFDPLLKDTAKPGEIVMVRSGDLVLPRRFDPIEVASSGMEVLAVMICQYWLRES